MAEEKIIIRFDAKGDKGLRAAVRKLDNDMRQLQGKQKKYNDETVLGTKNNRLLSNSFATLRSKMLLVNFAMAMGVRQLIGFTKEAAKVESMGRAFTTLSGGTENSSVAMDRLREATDGTMSQFDLFQQANNAMILGVSKNSEEMAEMFDIAQRLGRALGRDTRSSVESLITGIGRQSRLMLDNIGIIVKADEAYEAYAQKLGITADKLSDADKKTAFLEATMESARTKVTSLGAEFRSSQDSFDRFSAFVDDTSIKLGGKFKNAFAGAADAIVDFAEATVETEEGVKTLTSDRNALVIQKIGEAFGFVSEKVTDLAVSSSHFRSIQKEILDNAVSTESAFAEQEEAMQPVIESEIRRTGITTDYLGELKKIPIISNEVTYSQGKAIEKITDMGVKGELAQLGVSALANEMARLVSEGKSLKELNIGKTLENMALQMAFKGILGGAFGFLLGGPAGALIGAKTSMGIAHKGGLIKDNGRVQRFATGGSVRGGDNVPILAQGGEFVMQRSAVDSIGIENLNRMNQGGAGGSVTVNVSGNVMSQDYVEGELADQIKEAIRKGNDFGVS